MLGLYGIIEINPSLKALVPPPTLQVWQMASCSLEDFAIAPSAVLVTSRPATSSCWSPPPHGVYKVDVDGASSILNGSSSIGVIIRDWRGATIAALCTPLQTHVLQNYLKC